jgi:hypothetical protein
MLSTAPALEQRDLLTILDTISYAADDCNRAKLYELDDRLLQKVVVISPRS